MFSPNISLLPSLAALLKASAYRNCRIRNEQTGRQGKSTLGVVYIYLLGEKALNLDPVKAAALQEDSLRP